ncbi:MAG: AAA-like domain-containing protein [Cyanobacteria bacterium P01_G01_bin.54]
MTPLNANNDLFSLIDNWLVEKTGEHLSEPQRLILRAGWQGQRQTYAEIGSAHNYSGRYLQNRVAPELWRLLSDATGDKVTKINCAAVLTQVLQDYAHTQQLGSSPAVSLPLEPTSAAELPDGSVPLGSPFYIDCLPQSARYYHTILHPGALLRIKGPRQMGKTSLLNRILAYAQQADYQTVVLNFQQADREILADLNRLLRWLAATLTQQLKLPLALDEVWSADIGSKMSCTVYLEGYILERLTVPLVLAIDEASELFEYPAVSREFFAMIRTWHEYTKSDVAWQALRLVIAQSTEAYIPLNINQSPFNVGLEAALPPFTLQHLETLMQRHQLALSTAELEQLMTLLGGHPYLVRLALYYLVQGQLTFANLLETATTDAGIFRDHLHYRLWMLQQNLELQATFKTVINTVEPVQVPQLHAFKLNSMGLVNLVKNQVKVSCLLYQNYFQQRL